jgi:glycosyltransferase involved in cell wall biosynthesis
MTLPVTDLPTVLLVHNRYRWEGGEERSVEALATLLARRGHRVEVLQHSSTELDGTAGRLRAGQAMLRGGWRPHEVADAARRLRADVVHVHNMQPLFGPRSLLATQQTGARVVLHLHNYRLFCAIGIAHRDGEPCYRCNHRNTLPGVRLRCRGNLPEAATYGVALALHQDAVWRAVDRFVVPGAAAAARLEALGLPTGRTHVVPNFVEEAAFAERSPAASGQYALFAGRLVEEKGADTAIAAAVAAGIPLRIAGEGPEEPRIRALAHRAPAGAVELLGRLDRAALAREYAGAAVTLLPSRWGEPCPHSALESRAAGVPVLGSRIGGITDIIGEELSVDPFDVGGWAAGLRALWADPARRGRLGEAALADTRERFSEAVVHAGLLRVYGE